MGENSPQRTQRTQRKCFEGCAVPFCAPSMQLNHHEGHEEHKEHKENALKGVQ
jgi:hypothetical protein